MTIPPTPPGVCNCSAIRRDARRVGLLYDRHLAEVGPTTGQYGILSEIRRHGTTPPTLGPLAQKLVMDRTALTHTLKPLERDGLVALRPDPADRRVKLVCLTEGGEQRWEAAQPAWARAQERFTESFGAEQALALRTLLLAVETADLGDLH